FRISSGGSFTSLFSFNGTNGSRPSFGLVESDDGYFYGTTRAGGVNNAGTIFRFNVVTDNQPILKISQSSQNINVSWSVLSLGYTLQRNPILGTTNWSNVTNGVNVLNGQNQLNIPLSVETNFFRL